MSPTGKSFRFVRACERAGGRRARDQLRLPRWICGMMVVSLLLSFSSPVVGWSLARSISRVFEFVHLVFLLCENFSRFLSSRLRLSRWICGIMVSPAALLLLFSPVVGWSLAHSISRVFEPHFGFEKKAKSKKASRAGRAWKEKKNFCSLAGKIHR